ncbi:hypothetical protein ACOSP7_018159 [Xanthoceras sorbifolium]
MKSCAIFSLIPCFRLTYHVKLGTAPGYLPFFFFTRCLGERLYTSGSTNNRPFPDYSPKKPTIRNAELVYQISTAIKLCRYEPLHRCIVIQIAAASKDLKTAHELTRNFWEKPNLDISLSYAHFGSDPYVFDVFFQVLAEAGMLNEVRNFFDKMLNYGLVLSAFTEFPKMGVCWNAASYNIMIHCICPLGKIKEAHLLLLRMELRGFIPDVVMLKLIEEMQVKRLKPNSFTYNSIILFLCETVKIVEAKKVLKEMRNRGTLLDNVIYTTLIGGCCKLGDIAAAHKLFKEIGFCQTGKMVEARKLFHEMLSNGLKPDVVTYTALIDGYFKASNITQAMKLMEDMKVAGFPPDTFTYTTLMDAYSKSREMVKAYELVQEMLDKGLQPTVVTFNVLMNGFCMSGMLEDGERQLKWMLEKGIMPNATADNCLMIHHCIRNNMCVTTAIYKATCAQGIVPDSNTYNILIKGHSKARNMKEAWFLHREMVRKGFTLTVASYNALIKGFLKRKKFLEASQLFEEMRREGLFAEREIYHFFVDVNFEERNMKTTLELRDEAIKQFLVGNANNKNS